jgi:hypothetical protein
MTEQEKIERFDWIKALLDTMDVKDQRLIAWAHLAYLVDMDFQNLGWIINRVEELVEKESNKLLKIF